MREGEENTVVDSPYLKDESDALQLVWALGEVRTIMAKLNATELLPGSSVQTKAEILDYIKCGDKSFRPAGTVSRDGGMEGSRARDGGREGGRKKDRRNSQKRLYDSATLPGWSSSTSLERAS